MQCSRALTSLLVLDPVPVRVLVTLADAPSVGEEEPEAVKLGVSLEVPVPEADILLVPVPVPVVVAVSDPLELCGRASRSAPTFRQSRRKLHWTLAHVLPPRVPAARNCPRQNTAGQPDSQQSGMR
jgi:hypothetical protein